MQYFNNSLARQAKCCVCNQYTREKINELPIHINERVITNCNFSCEEILWKMIKTIIANNKGISATKVVDIFPTINVRNFLIEEKLIKPEVLNTMNLDTDAMKRGLLEVLKKRIDDGSLIISDNGDMDALVEDENQKTEADIQREKLEKFRSDVSKAQSFNITSSNNPNKKVITENSKSNGMRYINKEEPRRR